MSDTRKKLGDFGEQLARAYLLKNGYRIIESNFRCTLGEIDIVACEGETMTFVEVRTRRGSSFGTPEESVTPAKCAKLVELAEFYMQSESTPYESWRIDVVAVEVNRAGKILRIEVIQNAVD